MKFLLVNTNAAVKKIFSIAARKASILLDFANSIQEISIQEDYTCIFIDDGVLNTGNFQSIKNKMITTKFCLIMSKDSDVVPGFDNYIKKPFLPTDIYAVLKQEKRSDMSFSSFEAEMQDDSILGDSNINNGIKNIDLLDEVDNSGIASDVNSNINNIDLSEFSDNDDEFLSGTKDSTSINYQNNEEVKFTYEDSDNSINLVDSINDSSFNILDESNSFDSNDNSNSTQDSIEFNSTNIFGDSNDFLDSGDNLGQDIVDNTIVDDNSDHSIELEPQPNISNNASVDDIDFSSIFALQDEFLKNQNKDKPKGIIGGDIYTKKDSTSQTQSHSGQPLNDITNDDLLQHKINENNENISINHIDSSSETDRVNKFDELDENDDFGFDDDLNLLDEDFRSQQLEENKSSDDSHFVDSNDDFDVDNLSDEELDSLDDEALLKLQEEPQEDIKHTAAEPKILNKSDIEEVATILEDTQNMGLNNTLNTSEFKMENNELDSLTQEALSEAIDETNMDNDFNFDDDLSSLDSQLLTDTIEPIPAAMDKQEILTKNPVDVHSDSNSAAPNILSNPNLDLTEIIKSFPVDKLRELLSGVQITINITFPTKKQ